MTSSPRAGHYETRWSSVSPSPPGSRPMLLSEHGLAYHRASVRGMDQKEILLDFARSEQSLRSDYQVLKVDPAQVDALIISHGRI